MTTTPTAPADDELCWDRSRDGQFADAATADDTVTTDRLPDTTGPAVAVDLAGARVPSGQPADPDLAGVG